LSRSELLGRFGVPAAEGLLGSAVESERLRGVQKLIAMDSPYAWDSLLRGFVTGPLAHDRRAWLELVRGLAPRMGSELPRQLVMNAFQEGVMAASDPAGALLRETAALVLARSGDPAALQTLGRWLRSMGPSSEAALQALVAYPPRHLDDVIDPTTFAAQANVLHFYGFVADRRVLVSLRAGLQQSDASVRAAALESLARQRSTDASAVAKAWGALADPAARLAAARALLLLEPAAGRRVLATLLANDETRAVALALAERFPGPELVASLSALWSHRDFVARSAWLVARTPGEAATKAMGHALTQPGSLRSLALRAGVLRSLWHFALPSNYDAVRQAAQRGTRSATRSSSGSTYFSPHPLKRKRATPKPSCGCTRKIGAVSRSQMSPKGT